uniref:Kringle domain-containing protein n=1 Tax=Oxyrrhis marina TaxID=2969 RepID=A0A7S3UNH5_OXYMA
MNSLGFTLSQDCFVDKGVDYTGLHKQTKSGRPCIKWPSAPDDFTYCRNRDEEMNQPYCFFAEGEKEACAVPKCAAGAEALHGWVADPGTVTHEEPCTPKPTALSDKSSQYFLR